MLDTMIVCQNDFPRELRELVRPVRTRSQMHKDAGTGTLER